MIYRINRIGRTVDLDDALVNKYTEYDELHEQSFSIAIRTKYGHNPSEEEVTDEDLSIFCNDILLTELKALALLPKAVMLIDNNYPAYKELTKNGDLIERQI